MKLKNKSSRDYRYDKLVLEAGKELDIKDEKACKILLKQEGVEEIADLKEVEKLKKQVAKLEKEVKKPQKKAKK